MTSTRRIFAAFVFSTALAPVALAGALDSDALTRHPAALRVGDAADRKMTVALALPLRDEEGADAFIARATTPGSPEYRRFLSPAQFAARFGADPLAYVALERWATDHGLTVGYRSSARTLLVLTGRTARIQAAFGVGLADFRTADGRIFYQADRAPTLTGPDAPDVPVSVLGMSSYTRFAPLAQIRPGGTRMRAQGSGLGGGYNAADLRGLYSVPPQTPADHTETVAVFEQGGFAAADVQRYFSVNHLPAIPVVVRDVNGYGGAVNDPSVELEAVLDIDLVAGLNPAVQSITVYEDGDDPFGVALLDSLAAMADDDTASTISISYGQDEILQGNAQIAAEASLFKQLAAQGQEVFASAGDEGAYGRSHRGLNVADPGAQPYVTSVGGTTLFGGAKAKYVGEITWNDLGLDLGATGGGVSRHWKIPAYQIGPIGSVAVANGGSAKFRNMPDVAAVGDPATGVSIYSALNGGWLTVGGTSASSPIWAGYFSVLNAASKGLGLGEIGFFNPELYKLTSHGFALDDVNDIADGSNGNAGFFGVPGFNAGAGYDNVTGWGSFAGTQMLMDFTEGRLRSGKNPPPSPLGISVATTATTATLSWTASPEATGYLVATADLTASSKRLVQITNGTGVMFSGLVPSSQYGFDIYTVSPGGVSQKSVYMGTTK